MEKQKWKKVKPSWTFFLFFDKMSQTKECFGKKVLRSKVGKIKVKEKNHLSSCSSKKVNHSCLKVCESQNESNKCERERGVKREIEREWKEVKRA